MAASSNLSLAIFLVCIAHYGYSLLISDLTNPDLTQFIENLQSLRIDTTSARDDRFLNDTELSAKYCKRVAEQHTVTSGSGYQLTVYRIRGGSKPVLITHGFLASSTGFFGKKSDSLPCVLADAGYDVYLMNCRGNHLSRNHTSLSPEGEEFWKFSFHEIGTQDLPAVISFILALTGQSKLAYIGHSQGSTAFFVMCSEMPKYNNMISVMVALAPVVYASQMTSPPIQIAAKNREVINATTNALKIYEFAPRNALSVLIVGHIFCGSPVTAVVFDIILFLIWGPSFCQIDFPYVQAQVAKVPGGSSMRNALHFLQIVDEGRFAQFNFGEEVNQKVYGAAQPPAYEVGNTNCKVFIFYSDNDWFSSVKDVEMLKSKLPNVMGTHKVATACGGINHADHLWGRDIRVLEYNKIVQVLQAAEQNVPLLPFI